LPSVTYAHRRAVQYSIWGRRKAEQGPGDAAIKSTNGDRTHFRRVGVKCRSVGHCRSARPDNLEGERGTLRKGALAFLHN